MRRTVISCDWTEKDKLCGKDATAEVSLQYEGDSYSADLCKEHAQFLTANAAQKTSRPANKTRSGKAAGVPYGVVRVWANEHPEIVESVMGSDYAVPQKGRIPDKLIDAWRSSSA